MTGSLVLSLGMLRVISGCFSNAHCTVAPTKTYIDLLFDYMSWDFAKHESMYVKWGQFSCPKYMLFRLAVQFRYYSICLRARCIYSFDGQYEQLVVMLQYTYLSASSVPSIACLPTASNIV